MISSTLGALFGGTTRGAHHAFDWSASSLITPPNFGSGAGNCLPLMVVVALGEPSVPEISGEASVFIIEPVCCDAKAVKIPAKTNTKIKILNRLNFTTLPPFLFVIRSLPGINIQPPSYQVCSKRMQLSASGEDQ
jgi:hypothetical protein